jgi:NADH-quinone oxidoreductase subunit E
MSKLQERKLLNPSLCQAIDHCVKKFPQGKQQSALIMALRIVQKHYGWLSEMLLDEVADYLSLPPIEVYKVVSFYSMYERKPCGKHKIAVCNSISCALRGSKKIIDHLKTTLGVDLNETTKDGLFTLKETECLGACIDAPVATLDEDQYQERLTPEVVDKIIQALKQKHEAST